MKNVREMAEKLGLGVVCGGDGLDSALDGGVYCCDLLSIVMGRAPEGGAWITVMANINAVAVAVLCGLACVVIAEGMEIDGLTVKKAQEQGVVLLSSTKPVYETAKEIDRYCHDEA